MSQTFQKIQALNNLHINELNEMQKQMLEQFDQHDDMILLAPTGTGKTLAYLLPLMSRVDVDADDAQVIIIVPSRELALQIHEVIKNMKSPVRSCCCYGGRPAMDEHRVMMSVLPHVVIATPGRLCDHLRKRNIEVHAVRHLVIDEFDKCLEMGFSDEIHEAVESLPLVRRRVFSSATDKHDIPSFMGLKANDADKTLRLDFLHEKEQVDARIRQHIVHSYTKDKLDTLLDLLRALGQQSSLVFLNHRDAVERVYHFLKDKKVACEMFHGGMEQEYRERALFKFSNGTSNVLVSTDLGARGLDIPEINNIIHYHIPLNEDVFVHRNGRTARWQMTGESFFILNEEESVPEYVEGVPDEFHIPANLPPVQPSLWSTLYVGKGKKDKISKVDVLGFVCKQGGMGREDIGRIDVRGHCAYVAVRRSKMSSLLSTIKGLKIKGIKTIYTEAR